VEDFRAKEELAAGYASLVVDIRKLRLEGGVRFEHFEGNYVNFGFDQAAFATIPNNGTFPGFNVDPVSVYPNIVKPAPARGTSDSTLPSLHARYQASRDLIVRSAVSTNVGRPKFTDLAGLARLSSGNNPDGTRFTLTTGNASLKPAESISYDLTASYFGFRPLGLLEAGVFYKQIDGRVYSEVSIRDATAEDVALYGTAANRLAVGDDLRVVSRGNADRTTIYGAEIDWQMQLYFLPDPLNGFGLGANYTYSKSEETIPFINTLPSNHPSQPARAGQSVAYPKQPNDTANFFVSFQKWGGEVRFAGNYTGKNLRQYNSGTATLDQYNSARWRYDVIVNYRFNRRWSVSASVVNLNDEPLVTWEGNPLRVRNSEFLGRTGRVAVRYVFR
jgi:TonB-dependent receptor